MGNDVILRKERSSQGAIGMFLLWSAWLYSLALYLLLPSTGVEALVAVALLVSMLLAILGMHARKRLAWVCLLAMVGALVALASFHQFRIWQGPGIRPREARLMYQGIALWSLGALIVYLSQRFPTSAQGSSSHR